MSYSYKIVYKNIDEELKKQIIQMWMDSNVITMEVALVRINEVVLVGFDPNNQVCAVTTAYIKNIRDLNGYNNWYFLRIFIRPEDRGKIKEFKATQVTHEFLAKYDCPDKPVGVIAVAENKKITDRIMSQQGWKFFGLTSNKQKIYYVKFS